MRMRLSRRSQESIWIALWLLRLIIAAARVAVQRNPAAVLRTGAREGGVRAASASEPQPLSADAFSLVSAPGFGDRWNTYPWSMIWWCGRLYVGTNRAFPCVEYFHLHRAFPRLQRYPPRVDPDIACTPCVYDLPLQGELWRFTPENAAWTRVYQSPADIDVPGYPGKCIARDIGYRNMVVYAERDGTEALYVAAVGPRTITRGHESPRLLRSTDGRTFTPLPAAPGTTLGDLQAVGFRAMAIFNERLFVVAGSLYGYGAILEATDPQRGNDAFRIVSPPGMLVNELAVFEGYLYAGLRHPLHGYAVVRTAAMGQPPYTFDTIIPFGAYRRYIPSHCVLSMEVFHDDLYVGTSNPAEIVRIHRDGRWDLIVGARRRIVDRVMVPLSGMGDGFDDLLNINIARMHVHNGWLYAGTFNVASKQRNLPFIGGRNSAHQGFDLLATADGTRWHEVTRCGFDGQGNTVRTMASTPIGLFLGANEERSGARIYLGRV